MVAGEIEKRHLKLQEKVVDLIPLGIEFGLIFCMPFDEIAYAHNERRLQEIDFRQCRFENPGAMLACRVADQDEAKIIRTLEGLQSRPRDTFRAMGDNP